MEVPGHNVSTDLNEEEGLTKLCKNLEPIIWVLKAIGVNQKNDNVEHYFTGFTVLKEKGFVMTTTRLWSQLKSYKVLGRQLNEKGFNHTLTIQKYDTRWDIAIFKVNGTLTDSGEFSLNGSLEPTDSVMTIANADDYVGSFTIGKVCFQCIDVDEVDLPSNVTKTKGDEKTGLPSDDKTVLPSDDKTDIPSDDRTDLPSVYKKKIMDDGMFEREKNDNTKCKGFKPVGRYRKTPKYRIIGDIWNTHSFGGLKGMELGFEKKLHPLVPIIQCNGLNCSDGSLGSPIFNMDGKIVGMVTKGFAGYDIGIHMSLLRHFIKLAEEPSESDLKGKVDLKEKVDSKRKVDLKGNVKSKRGRVETSKKQKRGR